MLNYLTAWVEVNSSHNSHKLHLTVLITLDTIFLIGKKRTIHKNKQKKTLWTVVHKQTIPTKRLPLVGELSANFSK
jgi:hypothetical protein